MPSEPTVGAGDRFLAVIAYLGPLVALPLLARGRSRFVAYHTKQAMYLFAAAAAMMLLTLGLLYVFSPGRVDVRLAFLFLAVVFLIEVVLYLAGIGYAVFQAARGQLPMLPVLGELAGEA